MCTPVFRVQYCVCISLVYIINIFKPIFTCMQGPKRKPHFILLLIYIPRVYSTKCCVPFHMLIDTYLIVFIHNSRYNYPISFILFYLISTKNGDFRTFYRIKIDPSIPEIFNFKDIIYKNGMCHVNVVIVRRGIKYDELCLYSLQFGTLRSNLVIISSWIRC